MKVKALKDFKEFSVQMTKGEVKVIPDGTAFFLVRLGCVEAVTSKPAQRGTDPVAEKRQKADLAPEDPRPVKKKKSKR